MDIAEKGSGRKRLRRNKIAIACRYISIQELCFVTKKGVTNVGARSLLPECPSS
jgi:hypothetical protein